MYININGNNIYYDIIGKGTPIIMLHGWGVDHKIMSGCFESVFDKENDTYMRIYLDLPGMGLSKRNEDIKNSDDMLNVICKFINEIIPNRKFILCGESYGGYLARGLVKAHPDKIAGLILLCPLIVPGYHKGSIPPLTVLEEDKEFISKLPQEERESFEWLSVIRNKKTYTQFINDIYVDFKLHDSYFLDNILDGSFSYDVDDLDKSFEKPCLIMTGRQDTEVGYKDQFKLIDNYPNATYIALNRAGHNLQIEQSELFTSILKGWLNDNF